MRSPRLLPLPLLLATSLLAACTTGDDEDTSPVELQSSDVDAGEADGDEPDAAGEAGDADAAEEVDDAADAGDTAEGATGADGDLVDLTEAVPGTWPVGDAGTVTFSIEDGRLVLEDVSAADGWSSDVDEDSAEEIEVDFQRGDVEWEIEIELDDGGSVLEVEIDQDVEDAPAGSYDIGDAGTFAFEVADGRLELTDLSVADGWTVTERDEEADEIEIELRDGAREFDVEVELDDGAVELEIDYEVSGPVPA